MEPPADRCQVVVWVTHDSPAVIVAVRDWGSEKINANTIVDNVDSRPDDGPMGNDGPGQPV